MRPMPPAVTRAATSVRTRVGASPLGLVPLVDWRDCRVARAIGWCRRACARRRERRAHLAVDLDELAAVRRDVELLAPALARARLQCSAQPGVDDDAAQGAGEL